jgi:hypothetical protein
MNFSAKEKEEKSERKVSEQTPINVLELTDSFYSFGEFFKQNIWQV